MWLDLDSRRFVKRVEILEITIYGLPISGRQSGTCNAEVIMT